MKRITFTSLIFLWGYVNINVAADVPKIFTIKGIHGAEIVLSEQVTKSIPFFKEQIELKGPDVRELSFTHDQKGLNFLGGYATQRYVFKKTNLTKIADHLEETIGKLSLKDLGYFTEVVNLSGYDKERIPEGFQVAWIVRINDGETGRGNVEEVIGDPLLVDKIYKDCWQDNFASKLNQENDAMEQARMLSQSKLADSLSSSEQDLIASGQKFFQDLSQPIYLDQEKLRNTQVIAGKKSSTAEPRQQYKIYALLGAVRNFWNQCSDNVKAFTGAGISLLVAFFVYRMLPVDSPKIDSSNDYIEYCA